MVIYRHIHVLYLSNGLFYLLNLFYASIFQRLFHYQIKGFIIDSLLQNQHQMIV